MNKLLLFAVAVLCLSGCVDVNADIAMQSNGSGTLTLEYRILESFHGLGKLDGNEMYPIIPVGKTDFERSVKRIDGLQLVSFSTKTAKRDNQQDKGSQIVVAKLKFSTIDALVRFLDGAGQRAAYSKTNGNNRLSMVLWEKWEENGGIDSDLSGLAATVLKDYRFSLRFSPPKGAPQIRLSTTDGQVLNVGTVSADRITIPMSALIAEENGVQMEILWQ
ncbi:MAG: hypothetical protein LBI40_03975 [Treponema sp.]|jgi:hypothetical protein|nr:hypothetical protein [Treponema sp.]